MERRASLRLECMDKVVILTRTIAFLGIMNIVALLLDLVVLCEAHGATFSCSDA